MRGQIAPKVSGTGYVRASSTAAVGTVVAPASNTKGIKVKFCLAQADAGEDIWLMHKASAPTSVTDGTTILLGRSGFAPSIRTDEFTIPPGHGLYEYPSGAAQPTRCVYNYEVL